MMAIPEDNYYEETLELLADSGMAQALFAELEAALLELKQQPEDVELVSRVFLAIDKLKGGDNR